MLILVAMGLLLIVTLIPFLGAILVAVLALSLIHIYRLQRGVSAEFDG